MRRRAAITLALAGWGAACSSAGDSGDDGNAALFTASPDAALKAARAAAAEQTVPGRTEVIQFEDADGKWHVETARGSDRPNTSIKDELG